MNLSLVRVGFVFGAIALLALGLGTTGCESTRERTFPEPGPDGTYVTVQPTASEEGDSTVPVDPLGPTPDMLRTGDRIIIVFSGNPNAPREPHAEQIREDGYITPPLLGTNVLAAGKTIGRLQNELLGLYVPAFFRTLTVTVRSEERYFSVGGQVNRPGQFLYRSDMTVLKAIQVAGDFNDFANRRRVQLTRKDGSSIRVDIRRALRDPRRDPPVYPGDLIHVPTRW
jgi:protein involved in polysaccharide export with SLBB domain